MKLELELFERAIYCDPKKVEMMLEVLTLKAPPPADADVQAWP